MAETAWDSTTPDLNFLLSQMWVDITVTGQLTLNDCWLKLDPSGAAKELSEAVWCGVATVAMVATGPQ